MFSGCVGAALCVVALLMCVYLTCVDVHRDRVTVDRGVNTEILLYELMLCGLLFLAGVALALDAPLWLKCLAAALLLPGVILAGFILAHAFDRPAPDAEYIVVLGMALEKNRPTRDLLMRLDAAAGYAAADRGATLVVTGGNGGDGAESESAVMRRLLAARGVAEGRILTEDEAVDTDGNFAHLRDMVGGAASVAVVTSRYHMARALGIARGAGFTSVTGLSAPCDPLMLPANVMWEIVCLIDGLLRRTVRLL